ncbi:hypothetical protein [Paenibacillus eucommiae]|uniref:Uncharacterized protein n=1 Tax=Paenibacillus eucommiae TaxID=1355755 RepID=A0ABS4J4D6_9BACL|nr:hypothetical protein [Paenibacillus eucommiae]MBP1993659.1 hypothetical protein [Paenibacillus eucommiae]
MNSRMACWATISALGEPVAPGSQLSRALEYETEQNNTVADLRGLGLNEDWENPALKTKVQLT